MTSPTAQAVRFTRGINDLTAVDGPPHLPARFRTCAPEQGGTLGLEGMFKKLKPFARTTCHAPTGAGRGQKNEKCAMRIAQVAPLAEAVPPKLYGGTERVVSWLTEELVELGHDVTLFASGDSITDAELEASSPTALRLAADKIEPMLAYSMMLASVAARAHEFDIIHFHLDWLHIPLFKRLRVPFLTTLHGRLDISLLPASLEHLGSAPFASISDSQRAPWPLANWIGTVHHGLPKHLLKLHTHDAGYLAFLGRIAPEKGPETAIRLAQAAGMPLKIAAKIDRSEERYFQTTVKPLIDEGGGVEFIGEINEGQKNDFLGNAAAILFPICWPEPFGLVMIEAMACGTPVIAFREGSVAEVIEDGLTGFVVEPGDENAALDAIHRLGTLDRTEIRREFERRFTARRMARDYLRLYDALTAASREGNMESLAAVELGARDRL
jgi:glycosyltransferase involved in cell wall biosynthesis